MGMDTPGDKYLQGEPNVLKTWLQTQ